MVNGGNSPTAKLALLLVLGVWALLVLDLTAATPSMWLTVTLTAFVFALVGRLWRIEVNYWLDMLNPITIQLGDDDE